MPPENFGDGSPVDKLYRATVVLFYVDLDEGIQHSIAKLSAANYSLEAVNRQSLEHLLESMKVHIHGIKADDFPNGVFDDEIFDDEEEDFNDWLQDGINVLQVFLGSTADRAITPTPTQSTQDMSAEL